MIKRYAKLMGGILLVAGTTIGAAMLALPVAIGIAGFVPGMILCLICWAYFTYTALLMLETNLWMGEHVNLITMSKRTIGLWGELFSWVVYLFLLYALTTAYVAGSGAAMVAFIEAVTGFTIPHSLGPLPIMFIFGFFIYHGTRHVDIFNRILMLGLGGSFLLMIVGVIPQIHLQNLTYVEWPKLLLGVSIVATSFGYHIIIPSLTHYFHSDVKSMRLAIVIGSLFPLVGYALWTFVCLGVVPIDQLILGYEGDENGALLMARILDQSAIEVVAAFFSFFAIVTSFLGVSLSLSDFLADGFKIRKTGLGRIILCFMIFVPPFLFSITSKRVFFEALGYAGAFGVVTLLGLLPALMVWYGRYVRGFGEKAQYRAPGGKGALLIVMILAVVVVAIEIGIKVYA